MYPLLGALGIVLILLTRHVQAFDIGPLRLAEPANVTKLVPDFFHSLNSSRVKLSYGPFTVSPSISQSTISTFTLLQADTPCTNCTLTWMRAGLEHADGTYANINSSLWLHHVMLTNGAAHDSVCPIPPTGERFFASGNERTAVDLCSGGKSRSGYYLDEHASFLMSSEIINLSPTPETVHVTIEYEFIPGQPVDFNWVRPVWLDIANCSDPEIMPSTKDLTAPHKYWKFEPYDAGFSGRIVTAIGHVHDGATALTIVKSTPETGNQVLTVCKFTPVYGGNPAFVDPGSNLTKLHVSAVKPCTGRMTRWEEYSLSADYDFGLHPPLKMRDGSLAPLMGIALVYVALDAGNIIAPSNSTAAPTAASTAAATSVAPQPTESKSGGSAEMGTSMGNVILGVGVAVMGALLT